MSRNGEQSWNPFQHISWSGKERRQKAGTWGGTSNDVEEGNSDLTHSQSEPPVKNIPQDNSNVDTMMGSASTGVKDGEEGEKAIENNAKDTTDTEGVRNRGATLRVDTSANVKPREVDDDDSNGKKKKAKKDSTFFKEVHPSEPFTVGNQLQRTLLSSWINILLIMAPVGVALNYIKSVDRVAVFVVNFIAIIPLAAMLSFATEEIALRTGEVLGGLLNATFGNAVELIVAIIALKDKKFTIVQTSLVGSILSNLLLVMGCCFFFGGLRRVEQNFNHVVAQTAASMLALAVASLIVPAVFDAQTDPKRTDTPLSDIAKLSRGTAVILLIVYAAYLFFQLKTHQTVFMQESEKVEAKPWRSGPAHDGIKQHFAMPGALLGHGISGDDENDRVEKMLRSPLPPDDDEEHEDPQLHFWVALGTLTFSTVIIALCAEFMVDGIDSVTKSGGLSQEFVGLILLPIVGNAAEHATAVTVAIKDKMDLAIGVAVGSSMQVALFLIPVVVIIGWGMGFDEMNLSFDLFQVAVLFVAVLLVNYLIGDGKSHWLEGFLLICLYAILAVCSFCKFCFHSLARMVIIRFANIIFQGTPTRTQSKGKKGEQVWISISILFVLVSFSDILLGHFNSCRIVWHFVYSITMVPFFNSFSAPLCTISASTRCISDFFMYSHEIRPQIIARKEDLGNISKYSLNFGSNINSTCMGCCEVSNLQ